MFYIVGKAVPYGEGDRVGVVVDLVQEHFVFFMNGQPVYDFKCTNRDDKIFPSIDTAPFYFAVAIARPGFKVSVLPGAKMPSFTLPIIQIGTGEVLMLENGPP
jgi:hypothetical protein